MQFGLFQRKQESFKGAKDWHVKPGSTWHMRRGVPPDVRNRLGDKPWIGTTGTSDFKTALRIAQVQWVEWSAVIDEARRFGDGPWATTPDVMMAIDEWRRQRCEAAAGLTPVIRPGDGVRMRVSDWQAAFGPPGTGRAALDLSEVRPVPPEIGETAQRWAKAFFDKRPDFSRDQHTPLPVVRLLHLLSIAASDAEAWRDIADFDDALISAVRSSGAPSAIPSAVVVDTRRLFARAWLEVAQREETERLKAASFLAAADAASRRPESMMEGIGIPAPYAPRADDKTIAEVMSAYLAEQAEEVGAAAALKGSRHIFKALEEALGAEKIARSITRDDALRVKALLKTVPTNASKHYPGTTLREAAERGTKVGRRTLSEATVRAYVIKMSTVFGWAVTAQKSMDSNPAVGLAGKQKNAHQRRGFSPDELQLLFGSLAPYHATDAARFWVPALCLGGARLNEICQLKTSDVRTKGGITYLDLSEFHDGVRAEDKSVKNAASARPAPIHPVVLAAGFDDLVRRRRADGNEMLFPELKYSALGGYGHEFSKWFGRHLDSIGLTDKALVFHSFRHLLRELARDAGLSDEITDAIGGWAAKSAGRNYGQQYVKTLSEQLARIEFEGLILPKPVAWKAK